MFIELKSIWELKIYAKVDDNLSDNIFVCFCFLFSHQNSSESKWFRMSTRRYVLMKHKKNNFLGSPRLMTEINMWNLFNLYHSLGLFSRQQIGDTFIIFPRKKDFIFLANYCHWRQFA